MKKVLIPHLQDIIKNIKDHSITSFMLKDISICFSVWDHFKSKWNLGLGITSKKFIGNFKIKDNYIFCNYSIETKSVNELIKNNFFDKLYRISNNFKLKKVYNYELNDINKQLINQIIQILPKNTVKKYFKNIFKLSINTSVNPYEKNSIELYEMPDIIFTTIKYGTLFEIRINSSYIYYPKFLENHLEKYLKFIFLWIWMMTI